MYKYSFQARDWQGKKLKGMVEARNEKEAISLLRKKGMVITDLKIHQNNIFKKVSVAFGRFGLNQLYSFTRELATMIVAGLPLIEALDLIKEQSEGKMASLVGELLDDVEGGGTLSGALEKHQKMFGQVYIASIKAGEEAGVLEEVLSRLSENLEKKREFLGKIRSAMIYPVIVLAGMAGVIFIVMTMVIPKMTSLYSEFGTELPASTKILMAISGVFSNFFWILPLFLVAGFFGYQALRKSEKWHEKIDRFKLWVPIVGPLNKTVALTEVTRTLGMLAQTGVPIMDALQIVADASGNVVYSNSFEKAAKRVEKGFPFSEAIHEEPEFPPIVSQMLATGEQTGKLDEVLLNLSRYFEVEADQKVKGLTSAIEPLIMIVLGIGVGFLVFAVITPIYNLTSQF